MIDSKTFNKFLDTLKNDSNINLIESVREGYSLIVEGLEDEADEDELAPELKSNSWCDSDDDDELSDEDDAKGTHALPRHLHRK